MNITIFTTAFYESTLPLFKEMVAQSLNVKLVALVNSSFLSLPGFDLNDYKNTLKQSGSYLLSDILNKDKDPLCNYLNENAQNILVLSYNNFSSKELLHHFDFLKSTEIVHFIGLNPIFHLVLRYLKKYRLNPKIIWSLHEADPSRDFKSYSILKQIYYTLGHIKANKLIKTNHTLTFFSNHQLNVFRTNHKSHKDLNLIKFGLFDYFKTLKYECLNTYSLPENYILFVGMIKPYKGVEQLVEIISKTHELDKYNFVFAGKDFIGIHNQTLPSNISIYNKYLNDNELVYFTCNARCVILPYINASQSGIPSLSFLFEVPILYTQVDGLSEYLDNKYNGLSFSLNESASLISALEIIFNKQTYFEMQNNIKSMPFKFKYKWDEIAEQFINLYLK